MRKWYSKLFAQHDTTTHAQLDDSPPQWAPADELSRETGIISDAPVDEADCAEEFCDKNSVNPPRFLPSVDTDRIRELGCNAWDLELLPHSSTLDFGRFRGYIRDVYEDGNSKGGSKVVEVVTNEGCGDCCVVSNYPLAAGLYDIGGKEGVYYEVTVEEMGGVVAIGLACLPYPSFRFPGWNRLSAGLHLDDMQKFFEDPLGGRPYSSSLTSSTFGAGDTIGCGYVFATGTVFFTHNGVRLEDAFRGVFLPRTKQDVFAAIGVGGPRKNRVRTNFGGQLLMWKPGREWAWRVDGHVGASAGQSSFALDGEELPAYSR